VLILSLACYGVPWLVIGGQDRHSLVFLALGYLAGSTGFFLGGYFLVHKETRKSLKLLFSSILSKLGFGRMETET
jgi:hypothetical protein